MPEVWGELAKAQDNNQKINEAIDEAIANHEADPTAHLGSGESLEAHKTSEIIDHPARSVVYDKVTGNAESIKIPLLSTYWTTTGVVNFTFQNIGYAVITYGSTNEAIIKSREFIDDFASLCMTKDNIFQIPLRLSVLTNVDFYILCGWVDDYPDNQAFGWYYHNSTLYARFQNYPDDDVDIEITGYNLNELHIFRVEYIANDHTLYWYIDNTLVASYDVGDSIEWSGTWIYLRCKKLVSSSASFYFGEPLISV
jgi:hypothetical protein